MKNLLCLSPPMQLQHLNLALLQFEGYELQLLLVAALKHPLRDFPFTRLPAIATPFQPIVRRQDAPLCSIALAFQLDLAQPPCVLIKSMEVSSLVSWRSQWCFCCWPLAGQNLKAIPILIPNLGSGSYYYCVPQITSRSSSPSFPCASFFFWLCQRQAPPPLRLHPGQPQRTWQPHAVLMFGWPTQNAYICFYLPQKTAYRGDLARQNISRALTTSPSLLDTFSHCCRGSFTVNLCAADASQ